MNPRAATVVQLAGLAALAACPTFANTAAQDQTYARYEVCRVQFPRYTLTHVLPDGRASFIPVPSKNSSVATILRCAK